MAPPLLLLYGIDERSRDFEITSTIALVRAVSEALLARGWRLLPLQVTHDLVLPLKPFRPDEWLVFNLCEGEPGQAFYYARAPRILSELGYAFTGSDAWTLDETQFKWRMKTRLEQEGVPTPRWAVCERADQLFFDTFPAIVKPAAEHCSYGITRESVVFNLREARARAQQIIAEFDQPALIEEFLDSPEYNVSLWGNGEEIAVLGVSTMTYDAFEDIRDRLCTFEAKWVPESPAYQRIPAICPAPLCAELKAQIERTAIAAYRATGCRDYGRIDLRLKHGQPMVLDVNANCDVSPEGGFASAARAAGLSYAEMLECIIHMAMRRMPALAEPAAPERVNA
jgi:D-alanine-D-alanine ligase